MSYTSTVYHVMIASPQDVIREKAIAREVIQVWNSINSLNTKKTLLPVSWELDSAPSMRKSAQSVIDEQLLEAADLLIGIFWTRIGTPTEEAISGTVEEIQKHIASGKPAMIYFSDASIQPNKIDTEQYEALKQFKKEIKKRGLLESYCGEENFREKLTRQLSIILIKDKYFQLPSIEDQDSQMTFEIDLSEEAKRLLLEVSKDNAGEVQFLRGIGELNVVTNGKSMNVEHSPREEAKWKGAVDELELEGLIEDRGGSGTIFHVTRKGYLVADTLIIDS